MELFGSQVRQIRGLSLTPSSQMMDSPHLQNLVFQPVLKLPKSIVIGKNTVKIRSNYCYLYTVYLRVRFGVADQNIFKELCTSFLAKYPNLEPVDAAYVVSRHVGAVLGEIYRHAEHMRSMQSTDEAIDYGAGSTRTLSMLSPTNSSHKTVPS